MAFEIKIEVFARRRGLSLLEVLFATLLITVCIVFVISMMLGLLRSATKGEDQTVALELADKLLTRVAAADISQWDAIVEPPIYLYTHDPSVATEFRSEYRSQSVRALTMGDLYDVTLSVYWWPQQGPAAVNATRQGYGRLSVTLKRTVYVERAP